jgi:hypothetical protein
MKRNYRVLTVFDSSKKWACERVGVSLGSGASRLEYSADEYIAGPHAVLPHNGAPTRARDTLLARIMKRGKTWAEYSMSCRFPEPYTAIINAADQNFRWWKNHIVNRRFPNEVASIVPIVERSPIKIDGLKGKLISVEIECYINSLSVPKNTEAMKVKYDGSLADVRNGKAGREITRVCWQNSKSGRVEGVLKMAPFLKGAFVDKTCGLHVHVDARHLPIGPEDSALHTPRDTYQRLLEMQHLLKKMIPRSRWNNAYCRFRSNCRSATPYGPGGKRIRYHDCRYSAINWMAYHEHKTIEFRCGSGSVNPIKIESWALVCQHLFTIASSKMYVEVPKTWNQLLRTMPKWMAGWCMLRNMKLHGARDVSGVSDVDNSRMISAMDIKEVSACKNEY